MTCALRLLRGTVHTGDNLLVLRSRIASGSVALCYLDPPFNSGRDYSAAGYAAPAFRDTWKWGPDSDAALRVLMRSGHRVSGIVQMLCATTPKRTAAYLVMMAVRLAEIRRVLKPTGSLYLHCDPTASAHLKVILDALFGIERFQGEIVWKRSSAHATSRAFGAVHDSILFYSKGARHTWHPTADASSDFWDDIAPLNCRANERSGYPTQKPLALLRRIIEASSNPGDLVLDPFCGSGTTLIAAQQLGRRWVGIDMGAQAREFIARRFKTEFSQQRREAA